MQLQQLPNDVLLMICGNLNLRDSARLYATSKLLTQVCKHRVVDMKQYINAYTYRFESLEIFLLSQFNGEQVTTCCTGTSNIVIYIDTENQAAMENMYNGIKQSPRGLIISTYGNVRETTVLQNDMLTALARDAEHVSLIGCPSITDNAIVSLTKCRDLTVVNCQQVTLHSIRALIVEHKLCALTTNLPIEPWLQAYHNDGIIKVTTVGTVPSKPGGLHTLLGLTSSVCRTEP